MNAAGADFSKEESEKKRRIDAAVRQAEDDARYQAALRMARERRWSAEWKSTVTHPKYGKVVVPHISNLAACENAAEYWGVPVLEITKDAEVMAYKRGDGPLVRPKEFCKGRSR